jgi:hypothetical protein
MQKVQFIILLLKTFRNKSYDRIDIEDDKNDRNILKELNNHVMVFHAQLIM